MPPSRIRKPKSRFAGWYDKFAAFKVEDLFSKKKTGPGNARTIYINQNLPEDFHDEKGKVLPEHVYSTNQVITSKYTIVTFLPRNLLEQFRRVANIFFLFIDILQFFPKFSTISPGLVILPLLIVLAITGLKDGYEDIKRHQSDKKVNNSQVRVIGGGDFVNPNIMQRKSKTFVRGAIRNYGQRIKKVKVRPKGEELAGVTSSIPDEPTQQIEYDDQGEERRGFFHPVQTNASERPHWKKMAWEDLTVGDFVKILDNEPVPADVLICSTSEEENEAFVETKNLDGETNLKSRNAVPALTHLRSTKDCASSHNVFHIEADRPDTNMFKLNAAVVVGTDKFPVEMPMVLLRGTVLRNTKWVIGVVMYTGQETRIVMNSGVTPSKRSKVERLMNPQVFINLLLLLLMAVACGIVEAILEHRDSPEGAPWFYGDNRSGDNPSINGLVTFFFALITFQNIIPISLYISIEFVRTCQAAFIYFDSEMFYKGVPTIARSWNLSDDLGQIEYIFSDKTGTLTQNSMVFRKCSIGGKAYHGDENMSEIGHELTESPIYENQSPPQREPENRASDIPSSGSSTAVDPSRPSGARNSRDNANPAIVLHDTEKQDSTDPEEHNAAQKPKIIHHFRDADLTQDLQAAVQADLDPADAAHARNLNGFFTVLSLCHTALASVDLETGAIEYKAQSPDEAALVQAAADMGFVFRGREKEVLLLQTPFGTQGPIGEGRAPGHEHPHIAPSVPLTPNSMGGVPTGTGTGKHIGPGAEGDVTSGDLYDQGTLERYELLNILEFTSARKRMSVILRKLDSDDGRLFLLCKGADNVIFERLKEGSGEELKKVTETHLAEFAGGGLRTLTLAYKVVGEAEYASWSERYHEATVAREDREAKIEAVSDEIEHDLRLLGATAIEDRLQDGVPETIADLKAAGIKIWVATGDKLETAIAIGHSTNLISPESNIIVIRGGNSCKPVRDQIIGAIEEFFPDSGILDEHGQPTDPLVAQPGVLEGGHMASTAEEGDVPLRRVNTGVSSIVGPGNGERPGGFVLVVDGSCLTDALADEDRKLLLLRLAMVCEGVICCRVSPLQKALMVKLVKDGLGAMTLAIGDGANDVSMIQAADIGVGISGEEGLQAVNSSDYAFAQFRFLKRLLLVHGHWSYARNSTMILNFFYKNIVCIGVLWWFQIYCGWSSNYVFEYTYLLFWNSFWTIAPVIGIGLFDRFADDHILMAVPELYYFGREGKWFGMGQFVVYMLDGVVQSAIIYFLIMYPYWTTTARVDGWQVGQYEFSTVMAFSAVFTANFFNGLNTSAWTAWVLFAVMFGNIFVWVYTAIYDLVAPGWFATPVYGNNRYLFPSAYFWLGLPITIALCLLPRYLYKAWKTGYHPDDIDILRYISKNEPDRNIGLEAKMGNPLAALKRPAASSRTSHARTESIASMPARPSMDYRSASRTDMATGLRSVHRGFDFSTEEGGVAMQRIQTNLSERRMSSRNLATQTHEPTRRSLLSTPRFLRRKLSGAKDPSVDHR
ncbi:phospholipid-translocating ATPase [Crepidotus variabilis]|uniref:Phospholipid-transporting ATPase n=1 Tax=Crepidotus variabilis TaxID=179855 RepID=A0A9P6EPG6_9AGAR|nr:phospholipid-translocating ATPase [Crepidotus variabilis]